MGAEKPGFLRKYALQPADWVNRFDTSASRRLVSVVEPFLSVVEGQCNASRACFVGVRPGLLILNPGSLPILSIAGN
jgi:hypothetical protein